MTADPVLSVEGLSVRFDLEGPSFEVLRGIDFQVEKGRTLCLVGESGCGKSITAMAILGLLPKRARVARGAVRFEGTDLVAMPERALRNRRGGKIGMIFQEPMTSLNPTMTAGEQITEGLRIHLRMSIMSVRTHRGWQ